MKEANQTGKIRPPPNIVAFSFFFNFLVVEFLYKITVRLYIQRPEPYGVLVWVKSEIKLYFASCKLCLVCKSIKNNLYDVLNVKKL